jgi:hypothetical protein
MTDAEKALRELWTRKGVPEARQDEILADLAAKAQPGAKIGPFTIPEKEPQPCKTSPIS